MPSGVLRGLLELLLPPVCAGCGRGCDAPPLCVACDRALQRLAMALPPPRGLDALLAAAEYRGEVERWIRSFKYPDAGLAGLDPAPRTLVEGLAREAAGRAGGPRPGLVVPVPLHPRRLRERGFNPAALLARSVARAGAARCDPVALRRVRDTPSQTGLGRADRRRNVRGAFAATRPAPGCVWLVDDVVTTGSTLAACALTLRAAGASHVVALCAAARLR